MYHKNADLDPIWQFQEGSTGQASYRYILISKTILKLRENMLYFHHTVLQYAHSMQSYCNIKFNYSFLLNFLTI